MHVCIAVCVRDQSWVKLAAPVGRSGVTAAIKSVGFLRDGGRKAGDFHRSKDGGREGREKMKEGRGRGREERGRVRAR